MELNRRNDIYEFHAKDVEQTESLKNYSDHVVKEIKTTHGWDTDIQIEIVPEARDKRLFSVSMSVFGLGEPVVAKKQGKDIIGVLRKVRKAVMRQIHRMGEKRHSLRRRTSLKDRFAS